MFVQILKYGLMVLRDALFGHELVDLMSIQFLSLSIIFIFKFESFQSPVGSGDNYELLVTKVETTPVKTKLVFFD